MDMKSSDSLSEILLLFSYLAASEEYIVVETQVRVNVSQMAKQRAVVNPVERFTYQYLYRNYIPS
jgi:hypothetical protein